MMLDDLADACRSAGLDTIEVAGWAERGHGEMAGVATIVCHHTAGPATGEAPSLNYIRDRALSQLVLGRSGKVYVVAAGRCWHAGVVHERDQGNSWSIGIEAEATGTTGWPPEQYDAYVRLCAALIGWYRLPVDRVLGHKEVASPTGRKIDPNFDMHAFRSAVSGTSCSPTTPPPHTAPPAPPPAELPVLRLGSRHREVRDLQEFMTRVFPSYNPYTPTGFYGEATTAGIREFQRRTGIHADGVVGPQTRTQLARFGYDR